LVPQPSGSDLDAYYNQYHLPSAKGGVYDEFEDRMRADFHAKAKYVKMMTDRTPAHVQPRPFRLLDFGCGKGFFVKEALLWGFEAKGVDLSPSAIDYARNELGITAHQIRVNYTPSQGSDWQSAFDVITCWATLEHVSDPLATLRVLHECLKPGGYLFLDTGLGDVFLERFLPGHSQWYDAPQHLFVYSRRGLSILLEKAGFTVTKIDCNWERTLTRRCLKAVRHFWLCCVTILVVRPFLTRRDLLKMQEQVKWPVGKLISIVATKRSD
jgi:SAM-dependent methyltransferase